jgi:arylsulfatase A-like enzyme
MGFEHVELMLVGHNWWAPEKPPAGQHYERFYHMDGKGEERTKLMWENAGDTKGAAQVWHSKLPVAYHNTPWTADRAIEWLRHGRDADKPFCTWVSFPDPHHPFDCPEPWSRLHDPKDVDLPENRTRSYEGKPWWHKAAIEGEPADPKFADIRKAYSRIPEQTDEQLREIIANTYGQISFIDHQIGRIMNTLMEQGLDENTIVIYISDHGDWLGDHGLILKGPMHYEGLLKVPMIVKGPGVPAGKVVDEPVSTLDLGATFCDYGQAKAQLTQHGSSLRPLIEGEATREFARNEWGLLPGRVGVALELRTVRTRTHKLTVDLISGAGELYDLQSDPDELTNLFDMDEATGIQATLQGYVASRPQDMLPDQTPVGTA